MVVLVSAIQQCKSAIVTHIVTRETIIIIIWIWFIKATKESIGCIEDGATAEAVERGGLSTESAWVLTPAVWLWENHLTPLSLSSSNYENKSICLRELLWSLDE